MSIAQQSAMWRGAVRARQDWSGLRPATVHRPFRTLAKITGLITLTAFGAAVASAVVALTLVMVMARLAG